MDKKKGFGSLEISAVALGCMGMTGFYGRVDEKECHRTIQVAIENGVNFFDTANNYAFGNNEILLGKALGADRKKVSIATKVGVVRTRENPTVITMNGTPEYIRQECIKSLKRLGSDVIDLYYLHHLDRNTPIEETMHAMAGLVREGLVRHIGLGEMGAHYIRRAHAVHPITAVQAEYSLFSRDAEETIIPLCKELGIGFVACAPLCRGLLSGAISSLQDLAPEDYRRHFPRFQAENLKHNLMIVNSLQRIATEKSCTLPQLCMAWVMTQGSSIIPLFGTTKPSHVLENVKTARIKLTQHEIDKLGGIVSKEIVQGGRLYREK